MLKYLIKGMWWGNYMTGLTFVDCRHLTDRTGFGPEPRLMKQLIGLSRKDAVKTILNMEEGFLTPLVKLSSERKLNKIRQSDKQKYNKLQRQDRQKIKNWAVSQMLLNPNPLEEKLVWFWHNHFTSSDLNSTKSVNLVKNQSLLIRRFALGDFTRLLKSIPYDPLMLFYLDGVNSKKGSANENFARELLELFTLGEGHYSDFDVKEVARAFTGYTINNNQVVRRRDFYDNGFKEIFGQRGRYDGDDVIDLLLNHSRLGKYIAEKFWREFISIEPPIPAVIHQWAVKFRHSGYNIKALLKAVLLSDEFWALKYRGTLIKSPLDLIIGSLKVFSLGDGDLPVSTIVNNLRQMGQHLYRPPNVKGWLGGEGWIDDLTLPKRQQFLIKLLRDNKLKIRRSGSSMERVTNSSYIDKVDITLSELSFSEEFWESWLLPVAAVSKVSYKNQRQRLRAILLDPAYQLK